MSQALKFHFSLATLLRDGDGIVTATEAHPELGPRLAENLLTDTRALLGTVTAGDTAAKGKKGNVGTLTKEQNRLLKIVNSRMTKARATAALAFPEDSVKLRSAFCVGVNTPSDLPSILQRARTVVASLRDAANLPAVKAKGWLPKDTDALETAANDLATTDTTQETGKGGAKGATTARNQQANQLYDNLLTLQNAADLEWPEDPEDETADYTAIRAEFRLATFPPRGGSSGPETPPAGGETNPSGGGSATPPTS